MIWIGYVNRMDTTRKVSYVCKNNAEGSRIRGRPKNRWWNCELTDISRGKIKNWKGRLKNRADWAKSVKGAKLRIGLWWLLGRRRRRRRRRKKKKEKEEKEEEKTKEKNEKEKKGGGEERRRRRRRRRMRRRKEEKKKEGGEGEE